LSGTLLEKQFFQPCIKNLFRDFDLNFQYVYDTQAAADILLKRSKYLSLLLECFEIDTVNLKNSYQGYNWWNRSKVRSISHLEFFFDTNYLRTIAKIYYENADSVDQILEAYPVDPLFIERVEKIVPSLSSYEIIQTNRTINSAKMERKNIRRN
ncbi:unnamed protein product, partial [Didymodactylos carnosus]